MNGKQAAGIQAVQEISDGMVVGLGTGTTVYYFLEALAEKVKLGLKLTGVATSQQTVELARKWGIPMKPLNSVQSIDLTIDGADEVSPYLDGIKGGGGALLYEKLVAVASKKRIWIVDASKTVKQLGAFPLPVEVIPFSWKQVNRKLENKGLHPALRTQKDGSPFLTDARHYILDLHLNTIENPSALANELDHLPGIVEHGLFLGMTDSVIIGYPDGHIERLERH